MPRPPRLVAVDTNVALDFAQGHDEVCDAIETIRTRLPAAELWVPPTAVGELAHAAATSLDEELRRAALRILREHRSLGFRLINFVPLGFDHVERIAERLRRCGLLPEAEVHDSIVLTEAAALGCVVLTSSDDDLRSVDQVKLSRELAKFDLIAPVIATPREIVRKFFR